MALGMGLPAEQCDIFGHHNYAEQEYWSESEDFEVDEEYGFISRQSESVYSRNSKRTYGMFLNNEAKPDRRQKRKIHERFELLRDAIPSSCSNDKSLILTDAHEYIEKLQRQIQELQSELDASFSFEDDLSDCEDNASFSEDHLSLCYSNDERIVESNCAPEVQSSEFGLCSQPEVEVVRIEGGLRIFVQCVNTPGLLVDILNLLDSSGLNVEQGRISCEDLFFLECIGLKAETNDEPDSECVSRLITEELGVSLRSLIVKKYVGTLQ